MNHISKRIDWLNHSLEFFVVLIGILIAFQLNKCSSDKSQSKTIQIHLEQIMEETKFNKTSFEKAIAFSETNLLKLDTLIGLATRGEDFQKINNLSLALLNLGGVYVRKNAYQSLVESGDIRYMKDFSAKNKVINLYEYYKWVEAMNEVSMNVYNSGYFPYLEDNFDLIKGNLQSQDIYQSKKFLNTLMTYKVTGQTRLEKYKECLKEIERYLSEQ